MKKRIVKILKGTLKVAVVCTLAYVTLVTIAVAISPKLLHEIYEEDDEDEWEEDLDE